MRGWITISIMLGVLTAAPVLWASDGCVEISHVNVATAGNITSPGCYVLTSDLTQGLTISASHVQVDLNGFHIAPASGLAVTISSGVQDLEIANGVLQGADGSDTVYASGSGWINHTYRNLQILNDGRGGIHYSLHTGQLENLQLEHVLVSTSMNAFEVYGAGGDTFVRNLRIHGCEIRSETLKGVEISATSASVMKVYGFQMESSAVSAGALAAVFIQTSTVTSPDDDAAEFEGSIHDCDLVAPDSGGLGVVTFDARTGVLHCLGNTVEATAYGTGQSNEYAFLATGNAPIVIRNNTSRVVHSNGTPVWGNIVSPPVGHDGTNYLLSNWNDPTGAY